MRLFEYDSRRLATKAINPPGDWVSVVESRRETPVKSVGVGDTGHVIKSAAEVHGQFAARESPGTVFHLFVWPETGSPFMVTDCTVVNDYDEYGGDARIYEFVGRGIEFIEKLVSDKVREGCKDIIGISEEQRHKLAMGDADSETTETLEAGADILAKVGCDVDKPRCCSCGGEDFVEPNDNGDLFCGDCQQMGYADGDVCVICGERAPEDPDGKWCKHCQVDVVKAEISQGSLSVALKMQEQARAFQDAFSAPSCSRSGIHVFRPFSSTTCLLCGKEFPDRKNLRMDAHKLVILGWIRDWTTDYGVELCPPSGHADTFGEGMSAAKRHVARMLADREGE